MTQRRLTLQLRELEEDGLVHREVYPQVPPKVEFSLTELGRLLAPVIRAMFVWGEGWQGGVTPGQRETRLRLATTVSG